MPKLKNKKHELFAQEYAVDLNACQAYIRAGYSAKTAEQCGPRLLRNALVSERVKELLEKKTETTQRTARDAIEDIVRLARIAEANGDIKTAVRGFELEAKHYGGFIERKADVDTDGNDVVKAIEVKFVSPDDKAK